MSQKKSHAGIQVHCNKCHDKTSHELIREIRGAEGSEYWGPDYLYRWTTNL
jgi:hypothetical protein